MSSALRIVVVGVGNGFRGDDGVGLRVTALARAALPADVAVVDSDGEPARLLDAWDGFDVAFVVDAARSGAAPGTVARAEVGRDPLPGPGRDTSSHALGIADAVGLARALDRLPRTLVVYAVEGACFEPGRRLTDAVALGADTAARRLTAEVDELRRSASMQEGEGACA